MQTFFITKFNGEKANAYSFIPGSIKELVTYEDSIGVKTIGDNEAFSVMSFKSKQDMTDQVGGYFKKIKESQINQPAQGTLQ